MYTVRLFFYYYTIIYIVFFLNWENAINLWILILFIELLIVIEYLYLKRCIRNLKIDFIFLKRIVFSCKIIFKYFCDLILISYYYIN